jgi:hypothetical protein
MILKKNPERLFNPSHSFVSKSLIEYTKPIIPKLNKVRYINDSKTGIFIFLDLFIGGLYLPVVGFRELFPYFL